MANKFIAVTTIANAFVSQDLFNLNYYFTQPCNNAGFFYGLCFASNTNDEAETVAGPVSPGCRCRIHRMF